MPYAECPGCDKQVFVPNRAIEGSTVHCSNCDSDLEVVAVDPFELDWPYYEDDDDDWDDDDDE